MEGQVTGKETTGGIQLTVFEPKAGKFPEREPRPRWGGASGVDGVVMLCPAPPVVQEMGLGAGGWMEQKVYPDPYGTRTWDRASATTVHVHLAHAKDWPLLTGEPVPASPVTRKQYEWAGIPWFWLDDGVMADVDASPILAGVKTVPVG